MTDDARDDLSEILASIRRKVVAIGMFDSKFSDMIDEIIGQVDSAIDIVNGTIGADDEDYKSYAQINALLEATSSDKAQYNQKHNSYIDAGSYEGALYDNLKRISDDAVGNEDDGSSGAPNQDDWLYDKRRTSSRGEGEDGDSYKHVNLTAQSSYTDDYADKRQRTMGKGADPFRYAHDDNAPSIPDDSRRYYETPRRDDEKNEYKYEDDIGRPVSKGDPRDVMNPSDDRSDAWYSEDNDWKRRFEAQTGADGSELIDVHNAPDTPYHGSNIMDDKVVRSVDSTEAKSAFESLYDDNRTLKRMSHDNDKQMFEDIDIPTNIRSGECVPMRAIVSGIQVVGGEGRMKIEVPDGSVAEWDIGSFLSKTGFTVDAFSLTGHLDSDHAGCNVAWQKSDKMLTVSVSSDHRIGALTEAWETRKRIPRNPIKRVHSNSTTNITETIAAESTMEAIGNLPVMDVDNADISFTLGSTEFTSVFTSNESDIDVRWPQTARISDASLIKLLLIISRELKVYAVPSPAGFIVSKRKRTAPGIGDKVLTVSSDGKTSIKTVAKA